MRGLIESLEAFTQALDEAKADLGKRAVVLMGLPAAGKSTFVKSELSNAVPGFKGPRVENSDVQVKKTQFDRASIVFDKLRRAGTEEQYDVLVEKEAYVGNDGKKRKIATTFDGFKKLKSGSDLFKAEYRNFFASWFDLRDLAKQRTDDMFADKITKSADGLVLDTVASDPNKILTKLAKTKGAGMSNTIIYLEIDPKLSIIRDKYRGSTEGRSVGENVIMAYATKMEKAFGAYKKDLKDPHGVVDRLFHFTWSPKGSDPVKGTWVKKAEYRGDQHRQLAQRRTSG